MPCCLWNPLYLSYVASWLSFHVQAVSCWLPFARLQTKLRESIITCLGVIDHSIAEKKWGMQLVFRASFCRSRFPRVIHTAAFEIAVGPYMFGTSISVVDVIYAPLFVRLEAAVQTRGLEIPDTLPVPAYVC